MGARANLVLVDDAGWRLYYSHWAADTLCTPLLAGPDAATRYIAAQKRCEDRERDWLDDVWAEGGAVVDHTRRHLVFYGDQLMWELDAKRAVVRLLALTWPGWTVRWAYDGIGDIAAHVGMDRAKVRRDHDDESSLDWPFDVEHPEEECHLLTVRDVDGELTVYQFHWDSLTAWHGPGLLDQLPDWGTSRIDLTEFPESGFHVDVGTRTAGLWLRGESNGLVPALPELWPPVWRVEFWEDRFEEQRERCGGAVTFPELDLTAAVDRVVEHAAGRLGRDPVPEMLNLVRAREPAEGLTVELNPLFTAHSPVDPTPAEWSAVLRAAALLKERAERHP
jgi:hypothetical protein